MAIPFAYNVRSVLRRPWSTLATAVGIGLVVAILVLALALANGFQQALVETGSHANAIVMRTGADSELSSGIDRGGAAILRALPQIASGPSGRPLVTTDLIVLVNQDRLGGSGGSSNVTIRGVDTEAMTLRDQVHVTAGRMFTPGASEVVVGTRIARRFVGFKVGDEVKLGQRPFTVVGHFSAGGTAFESEVWGDVAVLSPVLRDGNFSSVTFRMKDPAQFASLKKSLEGDPRLGVQVQREDQYYANQSQGLATTIRIMGIFIVCIMAIGAIFAAMNTMFASIGARTREIATLRTLGFGPWSVMASFVAESVLIALFGGLVGCLLALPINGMATSTTNFATFSEIAFAFRITPPILLAGLLFAIALGVVGGILPAWKASRLPLAAAMRAL
jgi:ABC-type lipoprotein release transport system permease subunit